MVRRFVLGRALTTAALVLLLGGCGSGAAPASDDGPPTAAQPTTTTARVRALPIAMPGAHRAPREAVPILMYHVIGHVKPDTTNPLLWVSPAEFAAQVRALRRGGYHGVTLQQVWNAWHHDGKLPSKPIVFSFDDGYEGQVRDALPTLRRAGWPGVLNLTLANLPDMGGTRGIKRLIKAGWEIDSHTINHPDLTTLPDAELRRQLVESRARIKRLLGKPARFFCYPSGRYDARVIQAVRDAGYLAATTVQPGFASRAKPYELARVRVDGGMGASALVERLRAGRAASAHS